MRMPVTAVFVFVSVLASGPTRAQGQVGSILSTPPSQPARDQKPQPARTNGTGVLRGRVVDGQTGQPLVHARVRLSGVNGSQQPTTTTDESGSFEFNKLPPGRFSLWSYKGGYNQGVYPEYSQTLRSLSKPIILTEGQVVDNIRVPMFRGAAILGRVVDAYGDPVENVNVQVVAAPGSGSQGGYSTSTANDAGEFRVGRLQPGAYLVVATMNGSRPFSETDATTLAPTYYPGVLAPEQAQPVVVERGQTISGIDFQILEQSVTVVTGMVIDSTGQAAAGGSVHATSLSGLINAWNVGNQIRPDGSFELKLPPGNFRIEAYAQRDPTKDGASGPVRQEDDRQLGFAKLTVGGEPMANIVINTGKGGTISGRVVFDGEGQPPDPSKISIQATAQRGTQPGNLPRRGDECRANNGQAKVNPADLTFTIEGVYGSCVLNVNVAGGMGRWLLRSAMYHDVDLLDRPVEISNQQFVRNVPIVMTTRRGELSATVTDDQGSPTEDYVLLAFSTDKTRWSLFRYIGTAVRSSAPQPAQNPSGSALAYSPVTAMAMLSSTNGAIITSGQGGAMSTDPSTLARARFGVINWLPPGDYYVVALDDLGVEDMRDPAYLEQLAGQATRATLRDNEAQALQLHRLKAPPSAIQRPAR